MEYYKYFSGTTIFAFLNTPLLLKAAGFPKILNSYLNDKELAVETSTGFLASFIGDSSLLNYHKLPDVSE